MPIARFSLRSTCATPPLAAPRGLALGDPTKAEPRPRRALAPGGEGASRERAWRARRRRRPRGARHEVETERDREAAERQKKKRERKLLAVCSFASCSLLLALGRRVLTPPRSPARENGERGGRGGQRESKRFLLQGHPSLFTCFSLSLSLSLFALHPSPPARAPPSRANPLLLTWSESSLADDEYSLVARPTAAST